MSEGEGEGTGEGEGSGEGAGGGLGSAASLLGSSGGGEGAGAGGAPLKPEVEVPEWAKSFQSTELQELIANKKYADPEQLAQAYLHASSKLGADPSKMLELPDFEDAESANKFFDAVGRPKEAGEYTMLEGLDSLDQSIASQMLGEIHEAGLSDAQWTKVQQAFQRIGGESLEALETQSNEQNEADWAKLRTSWGSEFDANVAAGREAVSRIGLEDNILEVLQKELGTEGIMKWAHNLSRSVGEHSVDHGPGGGGPQFMNPKTAKAEYDRILADPDMVKRYNAGDQEIKARVNRLVEIYSQEGEAAGNLTLT